MPFDGTDQRKPLTSAEKLQLLRLQAGRERIRHRYLWTQYGAPCGSTNPLMGKCAIEALRLNPDDRIGWDCANLLAAQLPFRTGSARRDVMRYNDDRGTTHAAILNLYDRAIAALVER